MKFHVRTLKGPSTQVGGLQLLVELATSADGSMAVARDGDAGLALVRLHRDGALPAAREVITRGNDHRDPANRHVVPLRRVERRGAQLVIVSDWIEGIPLALLTRLVTSKRRAVDASVVARVVLDAVRGTAALLEHDAIAPGSLTPDAVWLGTDGSARIVEGPLQDLLAELPSTRKRLERHAYRSPEQVEGEAPTHASAQFSIATMAWELLAQRRRFAGLSLSAIDEAIRGVTWSIPGGATGPLVEALTVATERDPSQRFPSLDAMASTIESTASKRSPLARLAREYLDKHPALPSDEDHARAPISAPQVEPKPRPSPRRSTTKPSMQAADEAPSTRARPEIRVVEADPGSDLRPPPRNRSSGSALPGLTGRPAGNEAGLEPVSAAPITIEELDPASSEDPPSSRMVQDTRPPADSILPPSSPEDPEARRQVGRCELFVELAKGGMARVHLGRWLGAGGFTKIVAVKALHNHYSGNPEFVRMFLDEARVVARVRHPNVMPIIDLVEDRGELFIIMEYHPGVTLAHLLRQMKRRDESVPIPIALRVMAGVLHGLQAAHEATDERGRRMEIVHRDISPENIMVGTDGYARVIDFGIATALGRTDTSKDGQVKGKPSYLSPEQILGDREVSHRSDIYCASVVLWQALTGRRLIRGRNLGAVTYQILEGKHRPPSRYRTEVSKEVDGIVLRALERDPDARWAEAAEMAEALERKGPLATHREVGAWVHEVASFRLERAATVVAAVEQAPVEEAGDLDSPLSIRPAALHAIPVELRELDLDRSQDIGPDVEPPAGRRDGVEEKAASDDEFAGGDELDEAVVGDEGPAAPSPAEVVSTSPPSSPFLRHAAVAVAVVLVVAAILAFGR